MAKIRLLLPYALLIGAVLLFAWPLSWLASNSFKDEDEVFGTSATGMIPSVPRPPTHSPWVDPATGETRVLLLGPVRLGMKDGRELELGSGRTVSHRVSVAGPAVITLTDVSIQEKLRYAEASYDFAAGESFEVVVAIDSRSVPDTNAFEAVQMDYQPDDSWHLMDCHVLLPGGRRYQAVRSVPLSGKRRTSMQWRVPAGDQDLTRLRNWVELKPMESQNPEDPACVKFTVTRANRATAIWAKVRRNYDRVIESIPIWQYAHVSVVLALLNVILTVSTTAVVAYAFARLEWPGRELCFALLLGTILLPPQITLVPRFLIWKSLGAHDTLLPLWLPSAFGNAFFIYLLREVIRSVPPVLEDAARLDGCGTFGVLFHVVLPITKPSLAAIATFTLIGSWNDFLGPLLFVSDQRLYPLSFGVFALSVHSAFDPALVSAAALTLAAPIVLLFFLLQRHVLQLSLAPAGKG